MKKKPISKVRYYIIPFYNTLKIQNFEMENRLVVTKVRSSWREEADVAIKGGM